MNLVSKIFKRTDWYVTCGFGYYRNGGALEFHCGTDYGTNNQRWNLYGIEKGVVLSCGTDRDGSKYVWVNYPRFDKKLLHCHLDRIDVRANQEVQEGTLLGCVGNSGSHCGIHLHLGMQPSGDNCYEDPHTYEYSVPADMMNSYATVYGGPSTILYAPIGSVVKNGPIELLNKENDFYYMSYWTNSGLLKLPF
ncbi:MAG: M23 family metallopeptidase [Peptococcaceae bacterium]|nr:M23 family metallopeptidase [Peptococcaceae bacterium]